MLNTILQGNSLEVLKTLPNESVDCVVTSPPYWALRDYGMPGQLGVESHYQEYVNNLCNIFDEVKRVLKNTGSCWVNLGDTYSANRWSENLGTSFMAKGKNSKKNKVIEKKIELPDKCLVQIPSRFAIEMTNRGWILRNEIIWHKPTCMPSSVKDRFTVDFEKLFFFVKKPQYYFVQQLEPFRSGEYDLKRMAGERKVYKGKWTGDEEKGPAVPGDRAHIQKAFVAGNDGGRNKRAVWAINPKGLKDAHFAIFPEALVETPIEASCPLGGVVLDPFMGSGTTAVVAKKLGRKYVGIELNPEYIEIANKRVSGITLNLFNNA